MRNKSNFDSLRRILPILFFLLSSVLYSAGQDVPNPGTTTAGKKISFYPNPATSFITFDLPQKGLTLTVFNFMGKKMSETLSANEKTVLTLTDFSRGTYIYHLVDRGGKVIGTGKFQVSK